MLNEKFNLLGEMRTLSEIQLRLRKESVPAFELENLRQERKPQGKKFLEAFRKGGKAKLITEIKRRSPSLGDLRMGADSVTQAGHYLEGGATAISILTEEKFFNGRLEDLRAIRAAFPKALLLRKDFLFDEYHLLESRAYGADAVLLIVSFIGAPRCAELMQEAERFGLAVLLEVHDETELLEALAMKAPFIGINNRNLKTLKVSLTVSEKLSVHFNAKSLFVCESGIESAEQIVHLQNLGFNGFLVGSALMKSNQPAKLVAEFRQGSLST